MIKESILGIITLLRHLKWHIDALTLPKMPNNIPEFKMDKDDRLLVIAPHADDELIGCHSLISRFTSQTKVFYCSFLGHNTAEENRLTRQSEFCDYMQEMNADYEISSPNNLTADLSKTIRDYKPTFIALPSFIDWHPEHRLINSVLLDVDTIQTDVKILWYHVSLPLPQLFINKCLLMNKVQHYGKWNTMKALYKSQLNMDIERFKFIESIYGKKGQALETYLSLGSKEWKKALNILSDKEQELDDLKQTLGNIARMLKDTERIYKTIQ